MQNATSARRLMYQCDASVLGDENTVCILNVLTAVLTSVPAQSLFCTVDCSDFFISLGLD